jgi:hypothetical protein
MGPDPKLYREMSVPFESPEKADDAMRAFQADVEEARKKHKIPDVLVAASGSYQDGDDEAAFFSSFSFGNHAYTIALAAYAYGSERERLDENVGKLLGKRLAN